MIDIETHFILISDLLHIYNQHLLLWLVVIMLTHPDILLWDLRVDVVGVGARWVSVSSYD
jgi:hypothetical protein